MSYAPQAIRAPCGGQYASGGLMEYVIETARAGAMQPRQYAHGSLMEYVTKAARAEGGRPRWYTVGGETKETN